MKASLCVMVLLVITPILTAASLSFFDPSRWGGPPTFSNILFMAMFGLITVPLWITFIPTLIFTPLAMSNISKNENYNSIKIWKLITIAGAIGAIIGIFILLPMILMSLPCNIKLILNVARAGGISGSISYIIIILLYRFFPNYRKAKNC